MSREQLLMLGEAYSTFDRFEVSLQARERTACVLCPGSAATPCKELGPINNEDALLVVDEGDRTLLAVADAHHGARASHEVLERLAVVAHPFPEHPLALLELLPSLADPEENRAYASESTLLIAIVDRASSSGFGLSMGDSGLAVLGHEEPARVINGKNDLYARPCEPASLDPRRARDFDFSLRPGQLVLAYTDGVDECHYRSPKTSIQLHHMQAIERLTGPDPAKFVEELTRLALHGVGGNPGGQDNIAIIATRV